MTIPSNVTRNSYTGTGITGPYPVTFKFFEDADLKVTVADTNGVETVRVLTTDYAVTGAGEQAGGSITFTTAVTTGYSIVIEPKADLTQDTDIKNEGGNLRESIEDRFDRLCRDDQVQQNQIDRALKLKITDVATTSGELPSPEAGRILRWNDTATALVNASGATDSASDMSVIATGSTTARWISDRFADVVNVKDFGAVGDGVTDDTAALQTALNAAVGKGLTVFLPTGTYKTTAPLNWPTDWPVALVGEGVESTHINYTGSGHAINMYDAGASTKYIKSSIENLRLSGNGSTSTNGVNIRQGYAIALRNVRVYDFEVGVRIEQAWSVVLDFVRIDSCSQVGLELHNEANSVACYCSEFLNNAKGVYTAGARSVLFSECTLEANTQYGAYVTANSTDSQSESIVFHSCYIEGNATNDIRVIVDSGPTAPQSIIVRDCYFVGMDSKATIAVRVDQADHVVVDGCDFSVGTATYGYSLYISDAGTVDKIRFGKNRDSSTNGVYRGTGTTYSNETKQEARAWGRFTVSGGAIASTNAFNVSGVSRISAGVYEITLLEAMPGTDYSVIASAENGASYVALLCSPGQPISTTVFRINTAADAATAAEARTVSFSVFA